MLVNVFQLKINYNEAGVADICMVVWGYGSNGEKLEGDECEVHETDAGDRRWKCNGSTFLQRPRWVHGGNMQLWESETRSCWFTRQDKAANGSPHTTHGDKSEWPW